ncbi:helix-turn-helix domain-containing protein [Mixta calida]|uniref:helix-turn-helix domain-containing protein n=2 Tax=Mixta calida TaxID=665913 RepID=UPI001077F65C|nr:helix-turn-helix domain-containing protein [Mixta calida]EAC0045682.1 DNA-binding protein [Salmonella enterica subsp. enterica serovar Senftenberg]ELM3915332.1 helix-turn-helix domain-containing protein [Salmonella enterica subsp. enterica serovar Barranquilla]HBZ5647773.1 helix-turn-helix domain-containing protein [Salmonella enterica subsp. enterica serovar Goldcoast]EBR9957192.1 DNA-binding protein [Salmonella enterica subsp. enterica serovar Senftenberg]ECB7854181.1 DNA-binding protein 
MAKVSISEAARLTGKSRTTLHRLIKTGELSTCAGVRNSKMIDISELIRVFGDISSTVVEQPAEQVSEQRVTVPDTANEQLVHSLKQEVEHLRTLVSAQESHIDSLKQSLHLLEHKKDAVQSMPHPGKWWQFWK